MTSLSLFPRPLALGVLGGLGVAHDPLPRDLVQRAVRLPVAAPVEPVPHGLAARGGGWGRRRISPRTTPW